MKKKFMWALSIMLVLTIMVGTVSCAKAPAAEEAAAPAEEAAEEVMEPKSKKIAYLPQSAFANDFTLVIYYGVVDTIESYGYEALIYNADFDGATQVDMLDDAIAEGDLAGIIIQPIDSSLVVPGIKKANDAGIPVVTIVSRALGGDILVTVESDVLAEGSNAGKVIVKALEEKYGAVEGKVLEVHGGLQDTVAKGRSQGYFEFMADYPNVETITTSADGWSLPLAESGTRDMLTAHPDFDAIWSHADYFNDSIEASLIATDRLFARPDPKHIVWTSVDGAPHAFERIRQGIMDQTSANPNYAFGEWAIKFLIEYIEDGTAPPEVGDTFEEEGAAWSPARVVEGEAGPVMILTAFNVTPETVDSDVLWGNHVWEKPE